MRVTRRSTDMMTPPDEAPARKCNNNTRVDLISEADLTGRCLGQVSGDLLSIAFHQMRPNIWYNILPSEGKNDDVSCGTRQQWHHILPLLLHAGLIERVGEEIHVMQKKASSLQL